MLYDQKHFRSTKPGWRVGKLRDARIKPGRAPMAGMAALAMATGTVSSIYFHPGEQGFIRRCHRIRDPARLSRE